MFDFEKLIVYKKAKQFNIDVSSYLKNNQSSIDAVTRNQLRRAAFSIILNIAESTGRATKPDKRNFYVIARGSVYECVAIIDFMKDEKTISAKDYETWYLLLEEISKMLYVLINQLK